MIKAIKKKLTKKKTAKVKNTKAKKVTKKTTKKKVSSKKSIVNHEMMDMIAKKAYEYYEKRGCSHGEDLSDWSKAEKTIKAKLKIKG